MDQVKKKGFVMENRCYVCHRSEKSIAHFPLHCVKARLLCELFGVSLVMPSLVSETLLGQYGFLVGKRVKKFGK